MTAQMSWVENGAYKLSQAGSYLAKVIRGGKPAPEKRMSAAFVLNLVSGTYIVVSLTMLWVMSHFTVGINTQLVKCLPGSVFFVITTPPAAYERGQMIAYRSRGIEPFLKDGTLVTKLVAGVPGDKVEVTDRGITINQRFWGPLNPGVMRKTGKSIEAVARGFTIPAGELLVLGTLDRSYDGRYWGTIAADQVVGNSWRIW